MSGKSFKMLADQLWKNHGVSLITTFDSGIVAGSVLERRSWNDISQAGNRCWWDGDRLSSSEGATNSTTN